MLVPSSTTNPYVLLVKTNDALNQKANLDLQEAGYVPLIALDVDQAWVQIKQQHPALIVLDRDRAGEKGLKFCQELRQASYPVIILMLVEQETIEERVVCLEAGADDYLLKPYRSESFLHRVRFYLQPSATPSEQLQFGHLVLDLGNRHLILAGKKIDLTMKEFELLKYLMAHPREVVTREQILEQVWGYDFHGESNIIEVYIRYLRLKIEVSGQKRLIHTVRGVGYVLKES